jgi:hypothetical protein
MIYGLVKQLGGKKKFLGKIFRIGRYHEKFGECLIHYREEESEHIIAWSQDKAFCIDEDAWDFCRDQGVEFMTAYLVDKGKFVFVPADIVTNSPCNVMKSSEGRQYRVSPEHIEVFKERKPSGVPFIDDADCIDLDKWARG